MTPHIDLRPWSEGDLGLLRRLNAPELTDHLGGPEPDDRVTDRHRRYLLLGDGRMFRVEVDGVPAGSIGYWGRTWRDEEVWEVGWSVLPEFQGRGVASVAARATVAAAPVEGGRRSVHAFPSVDHPASNAVCRKAGFTLLGEVDFEYPPGRWMRCHDWVVRR
ncbi:RimJ/RimL family protein N-acetyltransferase [Saccharothrix saharensis]|uniref:RimJ/RimL family protein N-acetyltransferase n=1 Tax=Saccharothrix saharensis TaxID=571190 RepID=A0A543JHJ7_9PSEU|nr:GNAT family protein [Saccharothrix saharensis]TQM82265.1 RimJ/RimL family protein N-acetyltransferase [Saccharothrix saharensis]